MMPSAPVVRWASSNSIRSNLQFMSCLSSASDTLATELYVEKTTRMPPLLSILLSSLLMSCIFVEGLIGISVIDPCSSFAAELSEHTAMYWCCMVWLSAHSLIAWGMRESDGTRYSTSPPWPAIRSAMWSAVSVLPVPHAMTILPRSASLSPSTALLMASF